MREFPFQSEDKSIETFRLIAYGGHGICMAFVGVTDDRQGHGIIIENAETDAAIHLIASMTVWPLRRSGTRRRGSSVTRDGCGMSSSTVAGMWPSPNDTGNMRGKSAS